jgi:hypothetical protein
MNWGNWIAVSFVCFALFIGTLVVICVRQDISLVAPDYYKQELNYQQQIERNQNALNLTEKPEISVQDKLLQVSFENFNRIEKGEVVLFRPSNPNDDHTFSFISTQNKMQQFDISQQQPGMYKAKLSWTMEGKEFYLEQTIYL